MIIELIFLIIFIFSLVGVLVILVRKVPVLTSLPQTGTHGIRKHHIILDLENRFKEIVISFEKQIILHKLLSWVKVMTLRIETKVDHHLHKIRQKNKPK
ncbi:MAG: hypothetical protein NTY81_02200 [Candidatus Staskawiczbacteria bacterium]|nr:hypothetical protein [Candidatus Staskawiczbacteria bacterium]